MRQFQCASPAFTIRRGGAGGTGLQKLPATERLYDLGPIDDFADNDSGARCGIKMIKRTMDTKLQNAKGVIRYVTGETEGIASCFGFDKCIIEMNEPYPQKGCTVTPTT